MREDLEPSQARGSEDLAMELLAKYDAANPGTQKWEYACSLSSKHREILARALGARSLKEGNPK